MAEKTEINIGLARQGLEQLRELARSLAAAGPVLDAIVDARKELKEHEQVRAVIEADCQRLEHSKQTLTSETAGLRGIYDKAKKEHDARMAKLKKEWEELSKKVEDGNAHLAQMTAKANQVTADLAAQRKEAEEQLAQAKRRLSDLGASLAARAHVA